MPLSTLRHGYFPGKKSGWLEYLPRGVALDWARSQRDFTAVRQGKAGANMRWHRQELRAPILAVAATEYPFAMPPAMRHQAAKISPRN